MMCPSDLELSRKSVGDRAIESHPCEEAAKQEPASPQEWDTLV